jgi:hypothetical protein
MHTTENNNNDRFDSIRYRRNDYIVLLFYYDLILCNEYT